MKVNRVRDLIERVGWTLIELVAGLGAGSVVVDDPLSWWTPLFVGVVGAAKVLVAQHLGKHDDGAAIPGGVIEPER